MSSVRIKEGKAAFVTRRLPSGKLEKVCLHEHNIDFSQGCIAQVHGSNLAEVMENNGKYAPGNLDKYKEQGISDLRCLYCYAKGVGGGNWGPVTPREVTSQTEKDFEKYQTEIIRVGKSTECGHFYYERQLLDTFELCKKFKTRMILFTRALEYKGDIVKLTKETGSIIQYSIGSDELEPGVASQGFSNSWRINEAGLYLKSGTNTNLTIVADLAQSIEANSKKGFAIKEAINSNIPFRFIPLRMPSNKVAKKLTGRTLSAIIYKKRLFRQENIFGEEEQERPYLKRGNSEAFPIEMHPDFKEMLRRGIGICGRIGDIEYCDKCCTQGEKKTEFPASELVKVEYNKDKRKRNRRNPTNKNQLKLF
jgi:hypothetical protein